MVRTGDQMIANDAVGVLPHDVARRPASILVPIDFGAASARALTIAGYLGARCGAALRLLHAESADVPPYFTAHQIERLERERTAFLKQANDSLIQFGQTCTDTSFSTTIADRPPIDAILAASAAAELVVMGTHGRHGPPRWWIGSVAEGVLRTIARPLLVVRAAAGVERPFVLARIAVGTSSPPGGDGALRYARMLAGCIPGSVIDVDSDANARDERHANDTILVVTMPEQKGAWLANHGELLVRNGVVPVLFVPERLGTVTADVI